MRRSNKDVHTEHCCKVHGCKYGDENCTVEKSDEIIQSYTCEMCGVEGYWSVDDIRNIFESRRRSSLAAYFKEHGWSRVDIDLANLLIGYGWSVDTTMKPNSQGELHCFYYADKDKRMTWLEAIEVEQERG